MKKNFGYYFLLAGLTLWSFTSAYAQNGKNDGARYTTVSKLSSGKWIKLKLSGNDSRKTDDAIYKLTYDEIKKMGISDPTKVKIYGSGGRKLNENFNNSYVDDLQEIAVWINKGTDGIFNSGDYLLFYGQGTVKWTYNKSSGLFEHENNPYSTYGAYFMTEDEDGPKEMKLLASAEQTDTTFAEYNDYVLHERDSITITNSGRELFGESFATRKSLTTGFRIPGVSSTKVSLSFVAAPPVTTPLTLSVNGDTIINLSINPTDNAYQKARLVTGSSTWINLSSEDISTVVNFREYPVAYLDYIRLNVIRKLRSYGSYTFFRNAESVNTSARYIIDDVSANSLVFDLTDPYDTKVIDVKPNSGQLSFGLQSGSEIHEFVVIDPNKSFPTPESLGAIANQNLHGLEQTDMVILAPKVFLSQAEKLAEAHRTRSKLHVTVVQANLIFNEFSSGIPDATAYRRFMKMFYDRATTDSEKPKYLLFFGDGIFDNRFLTPACTALNNKESYLTTYQVKESADERYSYGTDDYFGILDDDGGINISSDRLDLGIGRFPVNSTEQANNAVNKVVGYMDNAQLGRWKNSITFAADDTDYDIPGAFCDHARGAERIAKLMENDKTGHPEYLLTKAYQDAFNTASANGKTTYPEARNKLMASLKNGTFVFNYTGHGSTTALTAEGLMTISDIYQMTFTNLPVWITATCDFGWFDGVNNSAGEAAFQNKKSGAIALFTTTRVVYSDGNEEINLRLMHNLFTARDTAGQHLRLGDVLRLSKNELGDNGNKLNYVMLGDPALRLNYPGYQIELDAIDGVPVKDNTGQEVDVFKFKALDKITLTGRIVDSQGNLQSGFNGTIHTEVYDAKQTLKSIKTDRDLNYFTFNDYPSMVHTGNNRVENGTFTITLSVPLDISYSNEKGKMNFYAFDETSKQDAQGYFSNYILNGSGEIPQDTGGGPEIRAMFLNTYTFKNGDNVNETPYFVADVYDKDGINISNGSLGHEISICIDKNPFYTYNLNEYYESESETYGEGIVKFSIPQLPTGRHTLVFKVWDLLNNSSTDSLTFTVVERLQPQLYDLTAAGNPARINTFFLLSHDRPESLINVEIRVYDLMGRPMWTHTERGSSQWLKYYDIEWNLCANNGMRLKPGVYVYQAIVTEGKSKEATKAKKIIILGQ